MKKSKENNDTSSDELSFSLIEDEGIGILIRICYMKLRVFYINFFLYIDFIYYLK